MVFRNLLFFLILMAKLTAHCNVNSRSVVPLLSDCIDAAIFHNPNIESARVAIENARMEALNTAAGVGPQLKLSAMNTTGDSMITFQGYPNAMPMRTNTSATNVTLGVGLDTPTIFSFLLNLKIFDIQEIKKDLEENLISAEVTRSYITVIRTRIQMDSLKQFISILEKVKSTLQRIDVNSKQRKNLGILVRTVDSSIVSYESLISLAKHDLYSAVLTLKMLTQDIGVDVSTFENASGQDIERIAQDVRQKLKIPIDIESALSESETSVSLILAQHQIDVASAGGLLGIFSKAVYARVGVDFQLAGGNRAGGTMQTPGFQEVSNGSVATSAMVNINLLQTASTVTLFRKGVEKAELDLKSVSNQINRDLATLYGEDSNHEKYSTFSIELQNLKELTRSLKENLIALQPVENSASIAADPAVYVSSRIQLIGQLNATLSAISVGYENILNLQVGYLNTIGRMNQLKQNDKSVFKWDPLSIVEAQDLVR